MGPMDRLRRVTDLFIEGAPLPLGMDDENKPVVIWVNKLNSFEVEEARRDAVTARGLRLLELEKDDNPEHRAITARMSRWSLEELAEARVEQQIDELYLGALNDLEADDDWGPKIEQMRRMPTLLDDEGAPADDPRRTQLTDLNSEYLQELQARLDARQKEARTAVLDQERKDIEAEYLESWRNRMSLDEFMQERRTTEIYAALRECRATQSGTGYDHTDCNHAKRLLDSRAAVRTLPEALIEAVIDKLGEVTSPERTAGNSGAPVSSSAPSEPQKLAEAGEPSTPEVTSPAAPTT